MVYYVLLTGVGPEIRVTMSYATHEYAAIQRDPMETPYPLSVMNPSFEPETDTERYLALYLSKQIGSGSSK